MLSCGPPRDSLPIFNEIRAADGIHTHIGVHKNIEYSSYKPRQIGIGVGAMGLGAGGLTFTFSFLYRSTSDP